MPKANSPEVFAKSANENALADANVKGRPAGAEQRRQTTPNTNIQKANAARAGLNERPCAGFMDTMNLLFILCLPCVSYDERIRESAEAEFSRHDRD